MFKNVRPLVALGLFLILPALACATLLPAGISSTALPSTELPKGTEGVGGPPPGGCPENQGRIVLSYDPKDIESVHYGIYLMDADGSHRIRLSGPDEQTDTDPAWSPDRCRIAFTRFTGTEEQDIYLMAADGNSIRRLTTDPARDMFPDWSPDGKQIVFVSYRDGGIRNLFVMNADGSDQRQLTKNKGGYSQWDQWSPTGDEIAFTYNPGGNQGTSIYAIKPDGSGQRQVAAPPGGLGDQEPAWSPDGEKIYVISNRSSLTEIWEMRVDGSGLQQLTHFGGSPSPEHSLRVSPDGKYLAFYGTGPEVVRNSTEIYVINADGSGLSNISNAIGADEWLDW